MIHKSVPFVLIVEDPRLRAEIDDSFPFEKGVAPMEDPAKLASLPFLNAVM